MTTTPRTLTTPALHASTFATRRTARSVHAFTLADLANDAATGHPSQRFSISRIGSGTWSTFYRDTGLTRALVVRAAVGRKGGSWTLGNGATFEVSITDGTTTVSSSTYIPDGLRGDLTLTPAPEAILPTWYRTDSLGRGQWVLDLAPIRAALTASSTWRVQIVTSTDTDVWVEHLQVEELPRWSVDTADDAGQLPHDYLPRGLVVDGDHGLQRIGATHDAALLLGLRTHHAMARDPGAPWSTSSTSYGALGQDTEPGGAAQRFRCKARRVRGDVDCPVRVALRYRLVGASMPSHKGYVRLHSGGGSSPYVLTLADTAGAWADCTPIAAALATTITDAMDVIWWDAKVDSGTLEICARTLYDDPT